VAPPTRHRGSNPIAFSEGCGASPPAPDVGMSTVTTRRQLHGLFCVRDCWAVAVTCGGWSSLLIELGSCLPDSDRCCPLRSGRSWPGCGPDVAPGDPQCGTGGHGRRGSTWCRRGGDGHRHCRRVRPVLSDHLPRWQALVGVRQLIPDGECMLDHRAPGGRNRVLPPVVVEHVLEVLG
jgi:hypothetical protein